MEAENQGHPCGHWQPELYPEEALSVFGAA